MRTKFLTVALAMTALAVPATVTAAPSGPGPGNAPNAKSCQKGGWMTLVREDGTSFTSEQACTSYAAQGGRLFRASEASCLNGGYANVVTSTGQSFSDQAACVSYVRNGGTLQPKPTGPTEQDCRDALMAAGYGEPDNAVYLLGTDGDDILRPQAGINYVICGFGGNDSIPDANTSLGGGDIFLGGAGDDSVYVISGGTFIGGDGDDYVDLVYNGGTFNGGSGNDKVGGLLDDGGTFNGGDGNDYAYLYGGTFNGEGGCDNFGGRGTFNPGDQSTC